MTLKPSPRQNALSNFLITRLIRILPCGVIIMTYTAKVNAAVEIINKIRTFKFINNSPKSFGELFSEIKNYFFQAEYRSALFTILYKDHKWILEMIESENPEFSLDYPNKYCVIHGGSHILRKDQKCIFISSGYEDINNKHNGGSVMCTEFSQVLPCGEHILCNMYDQSTFVEGQCGYTSSIIIHDHKDHELLNVKYGDRLDLPKHLYDHLKQRMR